MNETDNESGMDGSIRELKSVVKQEAEVPFIGNDTVMALLGALRPGLLCLPVSFSRQSGQDERRQTPLKGKGSVRTVSASSQAPSPLPPTAIFVLSPELHLPTSKPCIPSLGPVDSLARATLAASPGSLSPVQFRLHPPVEFSRKKATLVEPLPPALARLRLLFLAEPVEHPAVDQAAARLSSHPRP